MSYLTGLDQTHSVNSHTKVECFPGPTLHFDSWSLFDSQKPRVEPFLGHKLEETLYPHEICQWNSQLELTYLCLIVLNSLSHEKVEIHDFAQLQIICLFRQNFEHDLNICV